MREGRACRGRTHAAHAPPTRWPWCMRPPTLVGARVPRARPAPRTRSDCRTARAGGGPPGRRPLPQLPATFPSQPHSRPSHVPAVVLAAEPCAPSRNRADNASLHGLGPARRTSKARYEVPQDEISPRNNLESRRAARRVRHVRPSPGLPRRPGRGEKRTRSRFLPIACLS